MKFLHTADWHIGRKLHGYSLLEEQAAVFEEMMEVARLEEVDAIVIAGDIYDRSMPSVESVALFNRMMVEMNLNQNIPVLAISGNHDSATRLETGSPWLKEQGFHLHTTIEQALTPVVMKDVAFYLLPYIEPFQGREYYGDDSIRTITQLMTRVISDMVTSFDPTKKQVLVGHFFAAGSSKTDSETPLEVGGLESVPLDLLDVFDYVALGHLHDKSAITQSETVQYSGSLLKYSLSEVTQDNGVRLIEWQGEELVNTFIPITPLRDIHHVTELFDTLMSPDYYHTLDRDHFIAVTLTDTLPVPQALNRLREVYPRLIHLEREQRYFIGQEDRVNQSKVLERRSPLQVINDYVEDVTQERLTEKQGTILQDVLSKIITEK